MKDKPTCNPSFQNILPQYCPRVLTFLLNIQPIRFSIHVVFHVTQNNRRKKLRRGRKVSQHPSDSISESLASNGLRKQKAAAALRTIRSERKLSGAPSNIDSFIAIRYYAMSVL